MNSTEIAFVLYICAALGALACCQSIYDLAKHLSLRKIRSAYSSEDLAPVVDRLLRYRKLLAQGGSMSSRLQWAEQIAATAGNLGEIVRGQVDSQKALRFALSAFEEAIEVFEQLEGTPGRTRVQYAKLLSTLARSSPRTSESRELSRRAAIEFRAASNSFGNQAHALDRAIALVGAADATVQVAVWEADGTAANASIKLYEEAFEMLNRDVDQRFVSAIGKKIDSAKRLQQRILRSQREATSQSADVEAYEGSQAVVLQAEIRSRRSVVTS